MAAGNERRSVVVFVKTDGGSALQRLSRQFGQLNKSINGISGALGRVGTLFGSFLAGIGVQQFAQAADSINLLRDRINALSGGADKGSQVFDGLQAAAVRTRTSVESLAIVYARLAAATKDLGADTSQVLKVTEALQNSFRLSGATTGEATSAAIQLSQGLASGQLRGQELRSVLEANVVVGELLSKTFNVTRGELYKLAEQGGITASKVFKALLLSQKDLQAETEKLGITYNQVFVQALDRAKVAIANFSKQIDGPGKLNALIQELTDNIGTFIALIATVLIPLIAIKLKAAFVALFEFLKLNPIVRIFSLISLSLLFLINQLGGFERTAKKAFDLIAIGAQVFLDLIKKLIIGSDLLFNSIFGTGATNKVNSFFDNLGKRIEDSRKKFGTLATGSEVPFFERAPITPGVLPNAPAGFFGIGTVEFPKTKKDLNDLSNLIEKVPIEKFTKLNNEFKKSGDLNAYAIGVAKLEESLAKADFDKGTKDLFSYREAARKVKELELNRTFTDTAEGLRKFSDGLRKIKVEELTDKLAQGKITLKEFKKELIEIDEKLGRGNFLERGAREYIQSIGTLANQLSDTIKNAFSSLEDALFDFTKTGKFNFKDFAQSVLDDLNRVLIRTLIVQNLARGVNSFFSGNIGISDNNINNLPGAGGNGTTGFRDLFNAPASNVPLNPGIASAKLGTGDFQSAMTVNVINNSSDSQIEQRERTTSDGTKVLDVIIFNKVKEGISRGIFDRDFTANYGLKRRGV
jgi:tape measure domain-containing protein